MKKLKIIHDCHKTNINPRADKRDLNYIKLDLELETERKKFESRLDEIIVHQNELKKRNAEANQRKDSFDNLIRENEETCLRLEQFVRRSKKKQDCKEIEIKSIQESICDAQEELKHLEESNAKLNECKVFLNEAIKILPQDYIKVAENIFEALIKKHQTLKSTGSILFQDLDLKSEHVALLQENYHRMANTNIKNNLRINTKLTLTRSKKHRAILENHDLFQSFNEDIRTQHNNLCDFGKILRAINNITNKCIRREKIAPTDEEEDGFSENLKFMNLDEKLLKIFELMQMQKRMVKLLGWRDCSGHFDGFEKLKLVIYGNDCDVLCQENKLLRDLFQHTTL